MYKKTMSILLVLVLFFSFASTALALNDYNVNLSANKHNDNYYVDGIDAFMNPAQASEAFDVIEMVYFTASEKAPEINLNWYDSDGVYVINDMDGVVSELTAHPFAVLVVDESAIQLLDNSILFDIAEKQHILLIMASDSGDSGYASYYVISNEKAIQQWSLLTETNPSIEDLFIYANQVKNDLYFVYEAMVCELSDKLDNMVIPEENVVCRYARDGSLLYENDSLLTPEKSLISPNWVVSTNNEVRIFKSYIANISTLPIYTSYSGGSTIMNSVLGEAVLYTGTTTTYNSYIWFQVRGWHILSGGSVELVQGWARSWYSVDNALGLWGTGCERIYYYGETNSSSHWSTVAGRGTGFQTRSSTNLYNSSGTSIVSLPAGSVVWINSAEGYAGYSNPHYCSISGYTLNGTYTACTSTTFVHAGFNTGNPSTYRVYTT